MIEVPGGADEGDKGETVDDAAHRYDRRGFLARGASAAAALAAAGAGSSLLADCGASSSTATKSSGQPGVGSGPPKRGGSVTVGVSSEIDGFLPSTDHWDNTGYIYANSVFDTLTKIAADGSVRPFMAQSVMPNPDKTVWTVTLRPNISFHDGSPMNADVLVANTEANRTSPLLAAGYKPLMKITKMGDLAVAFTFDEPFVAFPAYLSTQVGYPVALAQLQKQDTQVPIGTGPFKYVSWEPNDHFTVERNPNYWRSGLPYLDSITYKPIIQDSSRLLSLESGTVDLMVSHDPDAIAQLRSNPHYQLVDDLTLSVVEPDMDFIILNTKVPPLDDLTVRQALAHAIDPQELVTLFGAGVVTSPNLSAFPPGSPYRPTDNGYPTYDLSRAKALVAQAAPRHGGQISLSLATIPDPRLTDTIEAVQSMWAKAGIKATLSEVQQVTFIDNLIFGDFHAYTDEQFSAPDPDLNYVWWSTTTVAPVGQVALNFARNYDTRIEAALQQGRQNADPSVRAEAYQTVDKLLAEDLPYLWISRAPWSISGSTAVQNFANPTLPDGTKALGFSAGVFDPVQMWKA